MLNQAFKCVITENLTANFPKKNLKVGFIFYVFANDAPKFTN